jgi:hypothetical protein
MIDIGIEKSDSNPELVDSSVELDAATGHGGKDLHWLQSYLARAIARGVLKDVERALENNGFIQLDPGDEDYEEHVDSKRQSILGWVQSFRCGKLIVESISVPWRSASSFLAAW